QAGTLSCRLRPGHCIYPIHPQSVDPYRPPHCPPRVDPQQPVHQRGEPLCRHPDVVTAMLHGIEHRRLSLHTAPEAPQSHLVTALYCIPEVCLRLDRVYPLQPERAGRILPMHVLSTNLQVDDLPRLEPPYPSFNPTIVEQSIERRQFHSTQLTFRAGESHV